MILDPSRIETTFGARYIPWMLYLQMPAKPECIGNPLRIFDDTKFSKPLSMVKHTNHDV